MVVLPCRVSGMMMLSSKRSATLRRMVRTSSSGKSTDRVSLPEESLPLVAMPACVSVSLMVMSGVGGVAAAASAGAEVAGAMVTVVTVVAAGAAVVSAG